MTGSARIVRGNALALPLDDSTVDLIVTSPPYFGLRSYQDGGEHYDGQLGSEATPAEFVDALIAATREMVRVVKPSGSIWVNLGDKYAQATERSRNGEGARRDPGSVSSSYLGQTVTLGSRDNGVRQKSLIGIPWRYAIRCIDDLGLILRAEVIWSKPNGLPESVTDRVRRSHEQWFHFTREPRYFSAVDEIREESATAAHHEKYAGRYRREVLGASGRDMDGHAPCNPLGKLPGSVWTSDRNDLGESRIGLVLQAVSEGHLTPEEGERILWDGRNDSGPRSTSPASAGVGWASSAATATGATGEPAKATDEHTGSPMNWSEGRSLEGSTSTTSAGTSGASTPTTSSPSLSRRTTPDDLASPSAPQVTRSMSATPTSGETASESAGPACEIASESVAPPSVWVIPTEPLHVPESLGIDHFAAFPTEWPRRIIQGWSPSGICTECGEGRRPVSEVAEMRPRESLQMQQRHRTASSGGVGKVGLGIPAAERERTITGEACACPEPTAPTTPAVVLDPFGGTGTTALVAKVLGRHGISVDMSADYCRLATWRTTDPDQIARAMRVDKPARQVDGQADLFDHLEETP